jgi:acyl-[acyl-carrier-protein]-phospholipid O-acyltransferase / long-chain-fatty-acid--[acyl-carrier-protein] ligase
MKFIFRALLKFFYRLRAYNLEALNTPGPVLLIPNHVSWLDWLFIGVWLDDDWKFVTSSVTANTTWIHRRIMVNRRTFPVDMASPYAARHMAEYLAAGGRLVLFAEGRITMTGSLMKLFEGTGFLLNKTNAKVIFAYQRGVQRIPWVRQPGWTRWFPRCSVHFSAVHTASHFAGSAGQARQRVTQWVREQMVKQQFDVEMEHGPQTLLTATVAMAKTLPSFEVFEDVTHQTLTFRRVLLGAKLLAAKLTANLGDEPRVGVLMPNVNATPVVLLSLWSIGKIPAILNFSTGHATLAACIKLAGLRHIVTSRVFLKKAGIEAQTFLADGVRLVYLEDLRAQITGLQKLGGLLRGLHLNAPSTLTAESVATILFTSGSEGTPKGVELTHRNLLANIRQVLVATDIMDSDRMFTLLPMFHCFGLTIGAFLPLVRGIYAFLYPSPLHYRMIPVAIYDRNCTILTATNTFLNGYARRANAYDFRSLRYLFAGAEKVQESTAATWAREFGIRLLEGYGATECSPVISVNTPFHPRFGSTGKLLPGMELKIEPVEGVTAGGRLLVRGPNVMKGYLNPDANAHFQALGGWYDTGDIAVVDDEGFIRLRGRLKRFAKVSGEMVSLGAVEEALDGAFKTFGPKTEIAILSQPDADKGELLIAVVNENRITLSLIRQQLQAKGLANICMPRELRQVKEVPKLGTGKTDYQRLLQLLAAEAQLLERHVEPEPADGHV